MYAARENILNQAVQPFHVQLVRRQQRRRKRWNNTAQRRRQFHSHKNQYRKESKAAAKWESSRRDRQAGAFPFPCRTDNLICNVNVHSPAETASLWARTHHGGSPRIRSDGATCRRLSRYVFL